VEEAVDPLRPAGKLVGGGRGRGLLAGHGGGPDDVVGDDPALGRAGDDDHVVAVSVSDAVRDRHRPEPEGEREGEGPARRGSLSSIGGRPYRSRGYDWKIVSDRPRVGVLAVQGNFREHAAMLRRLGAEVVEVRKPAHVQGLEGLVIPGGESTAIGRLIRLYGLENAIRRFEGAILGTCAGMILLDRAHLGLVDVEVERNAYGRQVASFEADLRLEDELEPLHGVFIRAPRVREVGGDVQVLAEHDGEPVLLRQGRIIVASFHPELTDDTRVHERFLDLVREEAHVRA
jgi:5'-phosphate synthase pdxT subunit